MSRRSAPGDVDALAEPLGLKGVSKDQVSRIYKELDDQLHSFRSRPLSCDYAHLILDATFEKVSGNHRVVSIIVAIVARRSNARRTRGARKRCRPSRRPPVLATSCSSW